MLIGAEVISSRRVYRDGKINPQSQRARRLDQYDSIIIGAGHNGLVCAAYLARGGQRVLVLEAADAPGGLAATREFHPGFHTSIAHSICHFSDKIVRELNLTTHGFVAGAQPLPTIGLSPDGAHVTISADSIKGAGDEDRESYERYAKQMGKFADALSPFWLKTIPGLGKNNLNDIATLAHAGLNIRSLGKKDMREFLRIATLPARDLMDENFENEVLKAALSWDGLIGARLAPRSPNGAVLAMLYRMANSARGFHSIPAGGVNGLINALSKSAATAGAELRCGVAVSKVIIEKSADGLSASGVRLANGEEIRAGNVISGADPQRTFLDFVGVEHLDIGFTNRIRRLRCNGFVAKLHLALSHLPVFDGLDRPDGRMIIAPNLDTIEFAFDNAKYGECPDTPVLEIVLPTVNDATLAPSGNHVLSAHVMYVPFQHKEDWTDQKRDMIRERSIDLIAQYAPNIREQIIHSEFLTPKDLADQYRVTGGHWHHTEMALDQMLMMRPTYEAAQYKTPIPGLFLCGAGCHPGGDIVGGAGHNAAREILR